MAKGYQRFRRAVKGISRLDRPPWAIEKLVRKLSATKQLLYDFELLLFRPQAHSPQGSPILVSAGDSPLARTFAARYANIQYAPTRGDLVAAKEYYKDVKSQMALFGRHPDDLRILPGIMPFVGVTEAEAISKRDHMRSLIHPEVGFGLLRPLFGDLATHPTSEKLASVVDGSGLTGAAKTIFDRAEAEGLTIKQAYEQVGDGEPWFMTMVGSTKQVADQMQQWVEEYAADGFNLLPHHMPGGFRDFVDLIIPELQRRRLFRTEYKGTTLRENLGLTICLRIS